MNANWLGLDLTHKKSVEFTKEVLNFMRNKLADYQEQYGDLYNLEATPAESTAYRLAKHDRTRYPDIITASQDDTVPYYTNSSHLPVNFTDDLFKALDVQDELQTLYTSGTVFHTFLGQKLPSWQATAKLVRTIAENYKLPYYTISPTYSVCQRHGYLAGEEVVCPVCGEKTEIYSRITGYYRPVQNWNAGKTEEFKERMVYVPENSILGQHHHVNKEICEESVIHADDEQLLLFTTKTCPNCQMAQMMLKKAGIKYRLIDAEENKELSLNYKIMKAPTLLVPNAKQEYDRYENASFIRQYIETVKH